MTLLEPQPGPVPIPPPTLVSRPFWEGVAEHRLLYQRCGSCGAAVWNPAPACRRCLSPELRWEQSNGTGRIYSWTVAWRPMSPAFTIPYAPVIVDLDEGYQMLSNLVGCDTGAIAVGLPVRVVFHATAGGTLPYFTPVPG